MRPLDAEAQVKELAASLNTKAMLNCLREYEKAGYPGQSMSDGRGGSAPCPVATTPETDDWLPNRGMPKGRVLGIADLTDRQLRADRLEYEQSLRHAALALGVCARLERFWCVPLDTDSEKAEKLKDEKSGVPCANVACDRWMTGTQDNRPRHIDGAALCERCYRYERRTHKRWTAALEAAEATG